MFKALVKKELYEVRKMYFTRRRKGKVTDRDSKSMTVLFIFLYVILAASFFALSSLFGSLLLDGVNDWIYFMIMTIMAFFVGLVGCVLSTTSVLFQAKDNEFLLSMPIPPSKILLARMISVYIIGMIYELMVIFPAVLFSWISGSPTVLSVIFSVLGIFILGFLVLAVSCLIGWIIALIMSRLKNKNIMTVVISAILLAAVFYLRFRINYLIEVLAKNAMVIGESMEGWGYPIYCLGLGMSGDVLGFLAFVLMTAIIFGLVYFVMSKSFMKIAFTKSATVNKEYQTSQIKTTSKKQALRKKEMKKFTSSPMYMLNCGLGLLCFVAGAVFLIIKMDMIRDYIGVFQTQIPEIANMVPVLGTFALCVLASLCDIAAPAISLEGPNLWMLQSMPIDPVDIFKAKIYNHCILTLPPAMFCAIVLCIAIRADVLNFILVLVCSALYIILSGTFQLFLNLKKPILDWTNEAQPIKQDATILIDLFGGMLLSAALGALFFLLFKYISSAVYLLICIVIFAALILLLFRWFKRKGRKIFAEL